ncbi:MAG: hypothetical protein ACRENS_08345 [Candidatus Eiseniibacteriota bacterium]
MKTIPRAIAISRSNMRRAALAFALLALALALTAPGVHSDESKMKMSTPIGTVSAKSKGAPEHVFGIPEYPGAVRTSGDPDGDGAQATVKLLVLDVKMQALRFNTDEPMKNVQAFYRAKLVDLGTLKESDEGPHSEFGDFHWTQGPGQHTIAAQGDHRVYMVAMKPHGNGCQFALISMKFED